MKMNKCIRLYVDVGLRDNIWPNDYSYTFMRNVS